MPSIQARKLRDVVAVVKAEREAQGLRQEDLAERLGLSRDWVIDMESGKGNRFADRLFRVLGTLAITVTLTYGADDGRP